MVWRNFILRFWWVGILTVAFLAGSFYLIVGREVRSSLIDQTYTQQHIIAKASAGNLESFFQAIGGSVATMSQLKSIKSGIPSPSVAMDAYVDQWRDSSLVAGIILTDDHGVVKANSSVSGVRDVGKSVADRDYFIWAKKQTNEGGYFIGQPVVSRVAASEGQYIVTVASAVVDNGVFKGVLTSAIKLQPLTQRFLSRMKVNEETNIFLVDQNKDILYKSSNNFELSEDILNSVVARREGQMQFDGYLIAYSPVNLGDQKWVVVVATPSEKVFINTISFHSKQILMLLMMSLVTFVFGVIVYREAQNKL